MAKLKESGEEKNSAVKIDSSLLEDVGKFISKQENRLKYSNKKQFIDLAVLEKLKKEGNWNLKIKKREK